MYIEFLFCSLYLSAPIWQMHINRWPIEESERAVQGKKGWTERTIETKGFICTYLRFKQKNTNIFNVYADLVLVFLQGVSSGLSLSLLKRHLWGRCYSFFEPFKIMAVIHLLGHVCTSLLNWQVLFIKHKTGVQIVVCRRTMWGTILPCAKRKCARRKWPILSCPKGSLGSYRRSLYLDLASIDHT